MDEAWEQRRNEIVEAALAYYERGWSVLPLPPERKSPSGRWKKWQTERMNADMLRAVLTPAIMGVGIIGGSVSGGLVILDIEPEHVEFMKKRIATVNTPTVRTARGGIHLYCRGESRCGKLVVDGRTVGDIRGNGGYVVAPPTTIGEGKYEWIKTDTLCEIPAWVGIPLQRRGGWSALPARLSDLRPLTVEEKSADLAWLAVKGVRPNRVMSSFFRVPPEWRCPGCNANKYDLAHFRKGERLFSGVEEHHIFGFDSQFGTAVRDMSTILLCYKCNSAEGREFKRTKTHINPRNPWAAPEEAATEINTNHLLCREIPTAWLVKSPLRRVVEDGWCETGSFESRSHADFAVVLDLVLAGVCYDDVERLFSTHAVGEKMRGHGSGDAYLSCTYRNALRHAVDVWKASRFIECTQRIDSRSALSGRRSTCYFKGRAFSRPVQMSFCTVLPNGQPTGEWLGLMRAFNMPLDTSPLEVRVAGQRAMAFVVADGYMLRAKWLLPVGWTPPEKWLEDEIDG